MFSSKKDSLITQENTFKDNTISKRSKEPPVQEDLFSNNKLILSDVKIKLPLIDFLKKPEKSSSKKDDIKINAEGL